MKKIAKSQVREALISLYVRLEDFEDAHDRIHIMNSVLRRFMNEIEEEFLKKKI